MIDFKVDSINFVNGGTECKYTNGYAEDMCAKTGVAETAQKSHTSDKGQGNFEINI